MSSTILSFEEAAKARFSISTTEELQQYLRDAGEEFEANCPQERLRTMCLRLVGLDSGPGYITTKKSPSLKAKDEHIVPPYRLDPQGKWGGRRIRISVPKPDGNTKAKAIGIQWNGKAPYWIPFDSVESVPIPIFETLKDLKRIQATAVPVPGSDGEFTTAWEFNDSTVKVIGDDPLTKDLASSMTEWYQWKGPNWFRARNIRELGMIADRLDVERSTGPQNNRRTKTADELCGDILLFLYADADAQEEGGKD